MGTRLDSTLMKEEAMEEDRVSTLLRRVDRIERENRCFRILMVVLGVVTCAQFLKGSGDETLKMRTLEVTESLLVTGVLSINGVASFSSPESGDTFICGGGVKLRSRGLVAKEKDRVMGIINKENPPDRVGKEREEAKGNHYGNSIELSSRDDLNSIAIGDPSGDAPRIVLMSMPQKDALFIGDGGKSPKIAISSGASGARVLVGGSGDAQACLGVTSVVNRRTGATTLTTPGTLTLFDPDGNVLEQKP